MEKTLRDLMELGRRFGELPTHVRGYCEPTELGMIVHLNTVVEDVGRLHAQRMVPWDGWRLARANPLTLSLEAAYRQLQQPAEDRD